MRSRSTWERVAAISSRVVRASSGTRARSAAAAAASHSAAAMGPMMADTPSSASSRTACTADSGAYYSGYAFYNVYQDEDLFGDGNDWDATVISGAADMWAGENLEEYYHLGGAAYTAESFAEDNVRVKSILQDWLTKFFPVKAAVSA